ncbi:hypothetical protein TAF16_0351 [Anoxybacillus flavithermus]|uniref:Uncharacterized protein n=1 Tax=Anoxybacillus flavithermus TaxID=33934 RepID=A0A178TKJ9_9BACL|nr:hypothetical protein TAF16_0351 [Anoxybacillus flavithermus]
MAIGAVFFSCVLPALEHGTSVVHFLCVVVCFRDANVHFLERVDE